MVRLVTDSSSDLPREIIDRYGIRVVPMRVLIDGAEYLEGVSITPQAFCEKMLRAAELPRTSQPSPEAFRDCFEAMPRGEPVLCLTISSQLSGTYQSACIGRDMADASVTVFDTLAGSLAHGLQVIEAARLAQEGASAEEIVRFLDEYRKRANILILLDTLENIVKGGRLGRLAGTLSRVLDIKVLLEGVNGKVEVTEKVRGKARFEGRVLDIIGGRKGDFSGTVFAITHLDNPEGAERLKSRLIQRFSPKGVIIGHMGATMGTYAGKGGMIVSFY